MRCRMRNVPQSLAWATLRCPALFPICQRTFLSGSTAGRKVVPTGVPCWQCPLPGLPDVNGTPPSCGGERSRTDDPLLAKQVL